MHTSNRKALAILFFTLIVVMLGFGMVMPIFPFLLDRLGGSGDDLGLLIALYAIMQLVFAPVWGGLSDRIGRKPILMISMVGNGLTLLLFGLSTRMWMLFVARTLSGLLSSATMPAAMAYIGDNTTAQDRGEGIGRLGAAAGLGLILGPALGGWLAGDSLATPFFIAAGLSLVSLLLIVLLLPESLPQEARRQRGGVRLVNPRELWRALFGPLGILLVMAFLVSFGAINFQAIFGLYAKEKFDYGPEQVGVILTIVAVVGAVIQGTLTGPLTRRWGEAALIKVCLLTNALGFLVLLTANSYPTVLFTTGFYTLSHTLLRPAVQALTSRRAPAGQGAAMGLNASFISLGQIAGPLWAGFAFDRNVSYPYLSGAAIMVVGFLISLVGLSRAGNEAASERWQPTVD
jgi:DHA1 family multidrug resistance protein-like MFS transporter